MDIPGLHSPKVLTTEKTTAWKLNQQVPALVVGKISNGKQSILIDGKTYDFHTKSSLEPGKSLLFKVVALSPPRLELVETSQDIKKTQTDTTTALSAQILKLSRQTHRGDMSNILNFIKSLSNSNLQSLSTQTLSLLNTLKKKVINANDLSNAHKLKPAILQSGLLYESKLAGKNIPVTNPEMDIDTDLKSLLIRIFRSLEKNSGTLLPGKVSRGLQKADALLLYQDSNPEHEQLKAQLKCKVDDVLSKITLLQKKSLDESQNGNQTWFFEVPTNFPSRAQSIPVTIYQDKNKQDQEAEESSWQAEFTLDLDKSGLINVHINISDMSVSVSLQSEQNNTAQALDINSKTLNKKLTEGGLSLNKFSSNFLNTGQINV